MAQKKIVEEFDNFIDKFLIKKEDYINNSSTKILTKKNIDECKSLYFENPITTKDSFEDKCNKQFVNASQESKTLFDHAIWLWSYPVLKKINYVFNDKENLQKEMIIAKPGMNYTTSKYDEVLFVLFLFEDILNKELNNRDDIKKKIKNICLYMKYNEGDCDISDEFKSIKENRTNAIQNVLLHLSDPDNYEPIVSDAHKDRIINCFLDIFDDINKDENENKDSIIKKIKEKIIKESGKNISEFTFYKNEYKKLWNNEYKEDIERILKYKKNIILYGPPGTSKTYSAKKIAKQLIGKELLINKKINFSSYLKYDECKEINDRVSILQLHQNYTYDNFVIGQTIKDNNITIQEGYFYRLCEKILKENDKKLPYVLILDEINRVDLTKLFGEAFSAIENRNIPIDLSYYNEKNEPYKLIIPDNLFIIGTMNEIDFSLERLDFALRRRFYWLPFGFDEEQLSDILGDTINDEDKETFIKRAKQLNVKISEYDELGKQYEIGHVFFGEIKNILNIYEINKTNVEIYSNKNNHNLLEFLWNYSICPMIEAYLDNIDKERKKEIVNELKKEFDGKK